MTISHPVTFTRTFQTKSGKDITIGTGTGTKWKKDLSDDSVNPELVDQVLRSLNLGFRHIDTAEVYNTHKEVGAAIKQAGIPREDLWITTKYCPGYRGINAPSTSPTESLNKALKELDTPYVDFFLIHQPFFTEEMTGGVTIESAWKELIEAKKQGKVRFIGVSNFAKVHLKRILAISESEEFLPVVNQIEFHPFLQNQSPDIVKFCQENNIQVEAYSPLAPLSRTEAPELVKYLKEIGAKYNKTPAQLLLRYTLQKGIIPITTSCQEQRIRQSLDLFDFELTKDETTAIDTIGAKSSYRAFFDVEFENL
ncbi:uncharacterized protein J8A68_004320 [[Candida] subhashii]|uniref:2-dehydropantolactone reductase n=1 Tax=[Candida] subhashii TaxID=561895 RepID=A0A8J5UKS2_9ASCO|nr:uncharacterized protein J8A68_004320 [[Candida] subhashii]KAG7662192.1 hypothetical protein J8A68_004320 [[Candida] subhashii]